ncbi:MAG: OmpA family protein [Marinovum sp.]|nr:OmpA family protein [Marinovum sp.]
MRLSVTLGTGAFFSAAFVISVAIAYSAVGVIEGWTTKTIDQAHEAAGLSWVAQEASGLNVTLSGIAPSEAARFQAMRLAATIVSGERLVDNMVLAAAPKIAMAEFSLVVLSNANGVSLIGLIPGQTERDFLIEAVSQHAGTMPVTDLLDLANQPAPEGWRTAQEFAVAVLDVIPQAFISLTPDVLKIRAITANDATKRKLETQLNSLQLQKRDLQHEVVLELITPRPVISSFRLRLTQDAKGAHMSVCSAETAQDAGSIRSAAQAAGATLPKTCQVGLGSPSPFWSQAVVVAIKAVMQLKETTLEINDHNVALTGSLRTNTDLFDQITTDLEAELPKGFFVTAQRPEPVANPTAKKPAQFIATRSPKGLVQLRGQVAGDLAYRTVTSYAQAQFGAASVNMAAQSAAHLGELWSIRVLTALDTLALLDKGIVRVTETGFTLSGTTGQADRKEQIDSLLRRSLGPEATFAIDVTYIEPAAPAPTLPSPQTCIASIAKVIEKQKLKFQPSSAQLEIEGRRVMDKIAVILKECGPIPLEIGGHTDSQGREEMNQKLSESRAQAVLTALMARRVSVASFRAHGYGEAEPIADNETAEGREANRRIEFKLIDQTSTDPASISSPRPPIDATQDTLENEQN